MMNEWEGGGEERGGTGEVMERQEGRGKELEDERGERMRGNEDGERRKEREKVEE